MVREEACQALETHDVEIERYGECFLCGKVVTR